MATERILRVDFDGNATGLVARGTNTFFPKTCALDSPGNIWSIDSITYEDQYGEPYGLFKTVNPGQAGEVQTLYYTFPTATMPMILDNTDERFWGYIRIFGNNLYFLYQNSDLYSTYQLIKFTDITGTAAMTIIDTTIPIATHKILDMAIKSDTEIYFTPVANTGSYRSVVKFQYVDSAWVNSTVVGEHTWYWEDNAGSDYLVPAQNIHPLKINSLGNFTLSGYFDDPYYTTKVYDANFNLIYTVNVSSCTDTVNAAPMVGTAPNYIMENVYTLSGYGSDDVWLVYPGGYWEAYYDDVIGNETEPTMTGVIVNIVSNYTDLGIANDKRVKRIYLDTESQYATCGAMTMEPDYGVNRYVHTDSETSEPSGATSLQPFAHPGRQTWNYTNSQFDSTNEAWQTSRIDLGIQGKKFRYSIKVGDVPSANHGLLRIRPPMIDVQIKGKY